MIKVTTSENASPSIDPQDITEKPIEQLTEHNHVVGANFIPGLISNELVHRVNGEGQFVVSMNETNAFFTMDQLFWTDRGWKAFDPEPVLENNTRIEVGVLDINDIVFHMEEDIPTVIQRPIVAWNGYFDPNVKVVRSIHLREGARSFFANGYLVGTSNPEYTSKMIAQNFVGKLSETEREELWDELNGSYCWDRLLGPGVLPAIKRAIQYETSAQKQQQQDTTKKTEGIGDKYRDDLLHSRIIQKFYLREERSQRSSSLPVLSLFRGTLLRNHRRVKHFQIVKNKIFWRTTLDSGAEEYGAAIVDDTGFSGQGVIETMSLSGAIPYKTPFSMVTGIRKMCVHVFDLRSRKWTIQAFSVVIDVSSGSNKSRIETRLTPGSGEKEEEVTIKMDERTNDVLFEAVFDPTRNREFKSLSGRMRSNGKSFLGSLLDKNNRKHKCIGVVVHLTDDRGVGRSYKPPTESHVTLSPSSICWLDRKENRLHNEVYAQQLSDARLPQPFLIRKTWTEESPELERCYSLSKEI